MSIDLSKRRLFSNSPSLNSKQHHRLPWLKQPIEQGCTQCGECIKTCPEKIIVKASGGFPLVDFTQGECSFCYQCAAVCPEGLFHEQQYVAWDNSIEVRETVCLAQNGVYCRSCSDNCEQAAINIRPLIGGRAEVRVDDDKCNSCGACIAACPSQAIEIKEVL